MKQVYLRRFSFFIISLLIPLLTLSLAGSNLAQVENPINGPPTSNRALQFNGLDMSNPAALSITGLRVTPGQTPLELQEGWALISYLRNAPMPIDQALGSIAGKITLAKNNEGQVYWPDLGVNQIGDMQPGQGYQIHMTLPGTLLYPDN